MSLSQEVNNVALAFYLSGKSLQEAESIFRRAFIEEVLRECRGNQLHVARKLGWHRNRVSRTLNELGIDPSRFYAEGRVGPPHRPAQRVLEFARRDCIQRRTA